MKETQEQLRLEELKAWEEEEKIIFNSLEGVGYSNPILRQEILFVFKTAWTKGYRSGSLNTLVRLLKEIGMKIPSNLIEPEKVFDQFNPSLN